MLMEELTPWLRGNVKGAKIAGYPASPHSGRPLVGSNATSCQFVRSWYITASMPYVDNLQCIISDAIIDQVRKRDDRKNTNRGHIGPTSETRVLRQQLTGRSDTTNDCACGAPVVLRDVLVNSVDINAARRAYRSFTARTSSRAPPFPGRSRIPRARPAQALQVPQRDARQAQ